MRILFWLAVQFVYSFGAQLTYAIHSRVDPTTDYSTDRPKLPNGQFGSSPAEDHEAFLFVCGVAWPLTATISLLVLLLWHAPSSLCAWFVKLFEKKPREPEFRESTYRESAEKK